MTPDPSPATAPPTSIARELIGGMLAAAIALVCFLPPLLHLVTGPLGPFIGGFVVGQHLKPEGRGRAIIAVTLGVCLAGLGAAAASVVASVSGPKGPPDWFPSADQLGAVLGVVGLYGAALGAAGAAVGARGRANDTAEPPETSLPT